MSHYILRCGRCGEELKDTYCAFCEHCEDSLLITEYRVPFKDDCGKGIWRYNWLPVHGGSFEQHCSAVFQSMWLARHLGLENLYIAFNGYWPAREGFLETCTFKEFEAAVVLQNAMENGIEGLVVASAGNTARAFAHLSVVSHFPVIIVVPRMCLMEMWYLESSSMVPTLTVGDGDYADAIDLARRISKVSHFPFEGGVKNIAKRDGLGATMLSAVSKMGRLPDHYFQAVGSGTGAIGVWEMSARLLVEGKFGARLPQLHLAQNYPFVPMVKAWEKRRRELSDEDLRPELIGQIATRVLSTRYPAYSVHGGGLRRTRRYKRQDVPGDEPGGIRIHGALQQPGRDRHSSRFGGCGLCADPSRQIRHSPKRGTGTPQYFGRGRGHVGQGEKDLQCGTRLYFKENQRQGDRTATVRLPEEDLLTILKDRGTDFTASLPCEKIKLLLEMIPASFFHVPLTREEEGVGICAGASIAGKRPALFIQSSGIGNMINALLSLTAFYEMPLAIFVSRRGIYKEKIEAQSPMGLRLPSILKGAGITHSVVTTRADFGEIDQRLKTVYGKSKVHAFLLSPEIWEEGRTGHSDSGRQRRRQRREERSSASAPPEGAAPETLMPTFTRYEILELIGPLLKSKVVVSNLGFPSKELYHLVPQPSNFYMLGSMGMATPIGLGLSLSTDKDIVVIEGDGSLLMNPGTLATAAFFNPKNLTIVAVDNGSYGSTGDQPTLTASCVDLEAAACAFGIGNTFKASGERDLLRAMEMKTAGLKFIHALAIPGNRDLPNIPVHHLEIKRLVSEFLKER